MPKTKPMKAVGAAQVASVINQAYPGAMRLGNDPYFVIRRIPTGVLPFDIMLGGGIALGRYIEFYGNYSALKSVLATAAAAQFLATFPDSRVMWIDSEGSFDNVWIERFNVDLERVDVVTNPATGETVTSIVEAGLKSGAYCLYIIDSITALTPGREVEYIAEEGEKAMGSVGKMTSAMMRRLTRLTKNDASIILINQVRENIGVTFGDTFKPTGGRAIPFYAGQRVEFRRGENLSEEVDKILVGGKIGKRKVHTARVINCRVEKDKTGNHENATCSLLWDPDKGEIDQEESLLILGMERKLVTRAAASISIFPGSSKYETRVQGWDKAKHFLRDNDKVARRLKRKIMETV